LLCFDDFALRLTKDSRLPHSACRVSREVGCPRFETAANQVQGFRGILAFAQQLLEAFEARERGNDASFKLRFVAFRQKQAAYRLP